MVVSEDANEINNDIQIRKKQAGYYFPLTMYSSLVLTNFWAVARKQQDCPKKFTKGQSDKKMLFFFCFFFFVLFCFWFFFVFFFWGEGGFLGYELNPLR